MHNKKFQANKPSFLSQPEFPWVLAILSFLAILWAYSAFAGGSDPQSLSIWIFAIWFLIIFFIFRMTRAIAKEVESSEDEP